MALSSTILWAQRPRDLPKVTLLISGRADCGLRALIAKALALNLDLHLWATLPFNHSGTRPRGTVAEQFSSRAPRWGLSWCVPQAACCWLVSKEPALSISVPCSSAISSSGSGLGLPARLVQPRSKGVGGAPGRLRWRWVRSSALLAFRYFSGSCSQRGRA